MEFLDDSLLSRDRSLFDDLKIYQIADLFKETRD